MHVMSVYKQASKGDHGRVGRKMRLFKSIMYYDKNGAGRDNEEGLAFE